jgi:hypothetical protein
LNEWSRLLITSGVIKIRVPNVIGLLKIFHWDEYKPIEKQEQLIQCLFGTQAYNGDFHYTSFTKDLITYYLRKAGLIVSEISEKDEWLIDVVAVKI